jgi:hypothetical protein
MPTLETKGAKQMSKPRGRPAKLRPCPYDKLPCPGNTKGCAGWGYFKGATMYDSKSRRTTDQEITGCKIFQIPKDLMRVRHRKEQSK